MANCADCGFLYALVHSPVSGGMAGHISAIEIPQTVRSGPVDSGMPGGYASRGLCLLKREELNDAPIAWHNENECPEFYEWIPGFTAAEHFRMRHDERMLAREDARDDEMRKREDRRDRQAQSMRRWELIAVVGTIVAILIAAVVGR